MLGGYAVTDRSRTFALVKDLKLAPGWNEFTVTSEESSATFVDPYDATCVEFLCRPGTVLHFDNFRMQRETLGKNLQAHGRCFDFGVRYLNCPGFTYGSVPYDEQRGYGFTAGKSLTHGGDLHVMNDSLTRDGFRAPATFKLKLPAGQYAVQAMTGNYWGRRDTDLELEIRAEGRRVYHRPRLSVQEQRAFKYAHERTDHDRRDVDLWGTYEEGTYFRTVSFQTEVTDGALELEFLLPPPPEGQRPGGESVWNYLIVYPADKADFIEPELRWLGEKIRRVYNKVCHARIGRLFALYNREEVICPEEYLWPDLAEARRRALKPTGAQKLRGYVHFLRHPHDLITPDSVPLPNEVGDRLAVFATPGETVQWAVGLYPLKDLRKVSVAVRDFRAPGGRIAGGDAEVLLASYRPMTPVTSTHAECFNYVGPGVLMPFRTVDVPKAFPRKFWISLPVPSDARPGLYQGAVDVRVGGARSSSVRVALRVLPFALDAPADATFAVAYGSVGDFWGRSKPTIFRFFRDLGLNTVWYGGRGEDRETMEKLAAEAGMKVERAEPDKYANWRWPEQYRAYLLRRARAGGKEISFTPRHTGHREGRRIRFTHGFWLWRAGIRHRVIQTQHNACERVYYAHAGHAKFGPCSYVFFALREPGLFLPAPTLYEVRDGIYDYRYIRTLEALAETSHRARLALAQLRADVDPDLDHYYFQRKRNFNHVGRYGLHDTVWPGRRYQAARWALAQAISVARGRPLKTASRPVEMKQPPPLILHAEHFGPFWVDEKQFADYTAEREGEPSLLVEVPATPVGQNWITVLAKMRYPSEKAWSAVLKDAEGKELARQTVGVLKRWKTRWVLHTAHLPVGRYSLSVVADGGAGETQAAAEAKIEVVPGIE